MTHEGIDMSGIGTTKRNTMRTVTVASDSGSDLDERIQDVMSGETLNPAEIHFSIALAAESKEYAPVIIYSALLVWR